MFFRPVLNVKILIFQKLEAKEKFGFNVEDVKDEIFDMAKPKVPNAITYSDLINCG